jgi:hypothetical protein
MARKNTLEYQIATAQPLSSSFISPVTNCLTLDNCSYQIDVATTDSTGTFVVEVSDNYAESLVTNAQTAVGTWGALPIGGSPVVASTNDSIFIDINQISFKAIRVRYTASTAGTGTCAIKLVCRQIGG